MKILFFQWNSFMNRGIERALGHMEIAYDVFYYQPDDWEEDEVLFTELETKLKGHAYALLLSVNYSPVLSNVCEALGVHYLAWIYDSPMHIRNLSGLNHAYTHAFLFDRGMAEEYKKWGFQISHMPLASDAADFAGSLRQNASDLCEVSLLGKLYKTQYHEYVSLLPQELQGYLNGMLAAQSKLYGAYLFEDMLTEKLLAQINEAYRQHFHGKFEMGKRELAFMMACELTGRERYMILSLLARHFSVNLYSNDGQYPEGVQYHGYADYYTQMPAVFYGSKINLNISLKAIRTGIPLRVLDSMACGGFVLTNYQEEIAEYLEPGKDCVVYVSLEDAYAQTKYYLEHDAMRRKIAENGREKVGREFTYEDRLSRMFSAIKKGKG